MSLDFVADPAELAVAVVQGEVLVEAAQHHREVLLLLASRPMPVSKQPLAGASEELSATLGAGDPDQGETPCSILPTDVLEAQKLKRLWPLSVFAPFDGCKTPKEQQPSFLLGHNGRMRPADRARAARACDPQYRFHKKSVGAGSGNLHKAIVEFLPEAGTL